MNDGGFSGEHCRNQKINKMIPTKPKIPSLIVNLSLNHYAWVVGSAANPKNDNPRDWDIIVPFSEWHKITAIIPSDAKVNRFGGWKFMSEGYEIDLWPGELSFFLTRTRWAWNPGLGFRFEGKLNV